jgi:hypothetical protein
MQRLLLILPRSRYGRTDAPYLPEIVTLGHKEPTCGAAIEAEGLDAEAHQRFMEQHSTNPDFWAILKEAARSGLSEATRFQYTRNYSFRQQSFFLAHFEQLDPFCRSCRAAGLKLGSTVLQGVAAN